MGGIRRNKFSAEQMEILRQNPYVRYVSEDSVSFTTEFKEEFWYLYNEKGMLPFDILSSMGIDYYMLGSSRVQGIANYIKKYQKKRGSVAYGQREGAPSKEAPVHEITRLRMEVEYLRQEQEFLKKIITAGRDGKSK